MTGERDPYVRQVADDVSDDDPRDQLDALRERIRTGDLSAVEHDQ